MKPSSQNDSVDGGVLDLVARWRDGDQRAAEQLFGLYAGRLIALAQGRLSSRLAGRVDAEDVVQSAYRSFFSGARADRFSLQHGGDLWRLLVTITLHKLSDQVDRHTADRRAVDVERHFASEESLVALGAQLATRSPSPVEAIALADELEQVMRSLEPQPRRILELRLQGHDLAEIATHVACSERTVMRVLKRVKQQLEQDRT
jgi:RNA polymerase sigma factor (sigma-70 family)